MTSTTAFPADHDTRAAVPPFAVAGAFLEALAAQDFGKLRATLTPDAELRALVPPGLKEWTGADAIADRFAAWFGDTDEFDLVDATVGEVGGRIHLRWRIRLQAERLGIGWHIVEQQAYADADENGRVAHIDLLCTGYRPETSGA
jgi:hypothetical protein